MGRWFGVGVYIIPTPPHLSVKENKMTEEERAKIACDNHKPVMEKRSDKSIVWLVDGEFEHRLDGPAYIDADGYKVWYQYGKKHRLDGPAVVYPNGTKEWYQYGKRHRLNGPAYVSFDGYKTWWQNDKRHRLDGPAVIYPDGTEDYWINDKYIPSRKIFKKKTKKGRKCELKCT